MTEIDAAALDYLLSAEGAARLDALRGVDLSGARLLSVLDTLRRDLPAHLAGALVEQAALRERARVKFERARAMLFTAQALEQSSAEVVSRYRAARYAGRRAVVDCGCGIGGDSLALAAEADVLGLDLDRSRLRLAAHNCQVYGVGERFHPLQANALLAPAARGLPFWADPARRAGERRVYSVYQYEPPLGALLEAMDPSATGTGGVKLSPGVDYQELDGVLGGRAREVEVISVRGEAREAVLWLGEMATAPRRATLLPAGHSLAAEPRFGAVPVTGVGSYLYEPDAAVVRAHLVGNLADRLGATLLDDQIAYLTADRPPATPFATGYAVEEVLPFNLKAINRRLRGMDVGELVIKRRGLALDPEAFRARLRYGGGAATLVLVLTRVSDRPTAIFCRPLSRVTAIEDTETRG